MSTLRDQSGVSGPLPKREFSVAGLSAAEVQRRREIYGYNEIAQPRTSGWRQLRSYFWDPIAWILEAIAFLCAVLRRWPEFMITLVLIATKSGVGFWRESRLRKLAVPKFHTVPNAQVKREGTWKNVAARELVPGDLIHLKAGDTVPADATIIGGDTVEVDQSMLTAEPLSVIRRVGDSMYSSSVVKAGEVDGTVTATGPNTYFARTAGDSDVTRRD